MGGVPRQWNRDPAVADDVLCAAGLPSLLPGVAALVTQPGHHRGHPAAPDPALLRVGGVEPVPRQRCQQILDGYPRRGPAGLGRARREPLTQRELSVGLAQDRCAVQSAVRDTLATGVLL